MAQPSVTSEIAAAVIPAVRATEASHAKKQSYGQILKSTALVGGSSVLTIVFGIVRTKAMALCLGPAGVGVMGLYSSIADLAYNLAGIGIQSSGVRQIAEAVGSGDQERIARTAAVLKRVSILLAVSGAGLLLLLARPVSRFTFGSYQGTAGVALLSVAVFFRLLSGGQAALIQGMRRIRDLATMSVLGAVFGTAVTIPLVFFFRERGVVPSLVAVAGTSLLLSWSFARKSQLPSPPIAAAHLVADAAALLKLGLAFMSSGFLTMGAAYAVRIIVLRDSGFEAAGLYQSAWTIGGLYVGVIMQAMGTDFYPRLTAVNSDDAECNRLVNEQARVGLLLGGPGVIATLTLAPLVIAVFYSARFAPAVDLLRWICLGMMLRVLAWPMGYVVVAKGAPLTFFWTEVAATAVHVGLAWLLVTRLGLNGSGAAFFGLYVWHGLVIYVVVRRLSGFRWSPENLRLGGTFLVLIALVFCSFYLLPPWVATLGGLVCTLGTGMYSIRAIATLVPAESMPRPIASWLLKLRPARAVTPTDWRAM
jgi:O-antigen/teichoic acid export membrane protein